MNSHKYTYHLHSLFPTPVFTTEFIPSQELYEFLDTQKMRKQGAEVSETFGEVSEDVRILSSPECNDLRNHIIHSANILAKEILGYRIETMTDVLSWVSVKKPGQHHAQHTHPNSVISGVYYFDPNPEQVPIAFAKSRGDAAYNSIRIPTNPDNTSTFSVSGYTIKPTPGMILLFPSYLPHLVDTNKTNSNRCSMAFNLMPKYAVGDAGELTQFIYRDAF